MRYIWLLVLLAAGGTCCAIEKTPPQIIEAAYTAEEPDAAMRGAMWKRAKRHSFLPYTAGRWYREIEERHQTARRVHDPATVRFLWNESALFIGIEMRDADLVDESTADQTHIFQQADSVELFLKSADAADYWEIYGSAGSRKTCYHFPSRGRLGLGSNNRYRGTFTVTSLCDGTLNQWKDVDSGWTLFFKIPVEELTRHGALWQSGTRWQVLLIRHNFSVNLPCREVTAFPAFSAENPHVYEEWGTLVLKRKETRKP